MNKMSTRFLVTFATLSLLIIGAGVAVIIMDSIIHAVSGYAGVVLALTFLVGVIAAGFALTPLALEWLDDRGLL